MTVTDPLAIWGRIVESSWTTITPDEARAVLKLKFSKQDKDRVYALSQQAQDGSLSAKERRELEDYLFMGRVLTIMHSVARRSLKASSSSKTAPAVRRKAS